MARVPCVGAIIIDEHRILLVQRRNPPAQGTWSLPGGRVEPGETSDQAVVREVREETGLIVTPRRVVGTLTRPSATPGDTYLISDWECDVTGGELQAADDAMDVMWASVDECATLETSPGLLEMLTGWGVLEQLRTPRPATSPATDV